MGFWATVGAQVVAGSVVAVVVAVLAVLVTNRYAARRAEAQARRERALDAAAEFSRIHGDFFTTWKAWEFHSVPGRGAPAVAGAGRRAELVDRAAAVEGGFESLIVRTALTRELLPGEAAAFWSLRFAFKQLRRAIAAGRELDWWRDGPPDHPGTLEYQAFKTLVAYVADILADPDRPAPGADRGAAALREITGGGAPFTTGADVVRERDRRLARNENLRTGWQWRVVAEGLAGTRVFRQQE